MSGAALSRISHTRFTKFLKPKDPNTFLLPLLDLICKEFPADSEVQMRCPYQVDPHKISMEGFLVLEREVEGVLGTAVLSLLSVSVGSLAALSSRITRQLDPVAKINVGFRVEVHNNQDAQAVATLLQAQEVSMGLSIYKEVDKEGWEALARAAQEFEASMKGLDIWISLEGAAEAKRENIKVVWEALEFDTDFVVWTNDRDIPGDGDSHQGLVGVGKAET